MSTKPLTNAWFNRIIAIMFVCLLFSCAADKEPHADKVPVFTRDLPEIRARGKLVALTGFGPSSYFSYKGRAMGYDYELLSLLGDALEIPVEIRVLRDQDSILDSLLAGAGDLIASNLTQTRERAQIVDFCLHHNSVVQVLVQRKPRGWRNLKHHMIEDSLIRNPVELDGRVVHVRRGSSYYSRLQHLADEIGGVIQIAEVSGETRTEELIRQVAKGEIELTVADADLARLARSRYPEIDIGTEISFPQRIAWAVRPGHDSLRLAINSWLRDLKRSPDFNVIKRRYYDNNPAFQRWVRSPYSSLNGGAISRYDSLIRRGAAELGWDWRLLAAQIFQESRFNPRARSWAGAIGLMQLLPETAKAYGAQDPENPVQSIAAGTRYLKWIQNRWQSIADRAERRKFVLASYNVGLGHVRDAQRLCALAGQDSLNWGAGVAIQMSRLEDADVYNLPLVKYGYCRGREPVNYVRDILDRHYHYVTLFQEADSISAPTTLADPPVPLTRVE